LKAGLPYAIPAALLFWLILRRGAILSPRIAGATTGMLAGLVAPLCLKYIAQIGMSGTFSFGTLDLHC
jgi:hypothetical protein